MQPAVLPTQGACGQEDRTERSVGQRRAGNTCSEARGDAGRACVGVPDGDDVDGGGVAGEGRWS